MSAYPPEVILKALPHRYPFLLVDRVESHEKGVEATCVKCITFNEPIFTGHFPDNPIYPGVLQIEMGLQATILMYADLEAMAKGDGKPWKGFFVAADKLKLLAPVKPGDVLRITAKHKEGLGAMNRVALTILNQNDEKILKGLVTVTVSEE